MNTQQMSAQNKSNKHRGFSTWNWSIVFAAVMLSPLHAEPPKQLNVFETQKAFAGLDEEVYPLGWTKNGEGLALLRAHPNEAADERLWKIQVLDLVNDKAILNAEIRHLDKGGLTTFWAVYGKRVMALITPHGIQATEFHVRRFPALLGKYRGDSYEVGMERAYGKEPNFEYRGLTSLKVKLNNGAGKSKVVYNKQWQQWYPMAAGVIGYLPNPQGDRIAILLGMTQRGYESAPHVRLLTVVGARVGEKF